MYYIYLLKSVNFNKSYVGFTENIEKRVGEHNEGKSRFTRKYKPWKLIYSETFENPNDAIKKEKYYKCHAGRLKLKELFINCGVV